MGEQHSSPATPDQWALRWLKALPGGDSNVRAAFTCWARHSPRYVEAYCRQKMVDTELRGWIRSGGSMWRNQWQREHGRALPEIVTRGAEHRIYNVSLG
jgi:hypothetical protein